MRKIYVNGRFLSQPITGVQRFALEMCKALANHGFEVVILSPSESKIKSVNNCTIKKFGVLNGILWEQIELLFFLLWHKKPLLINFGASGPIFYSNRIVTIHDISYYINSKWFSWWYSAYYKLVTPIFTRLSKKVITVSEFSKNEIIKKLKIDAQKIVVINNAVSQDLKEIMQTENYNAEKYILSVGSLDPRKNISKLVEAYKMSEISNEFKLLIIGRTAPMFNIKLEKDIKSMSLGYVTDDELAKLYRNATLFVYPSLYEGFGIPPLEAMAFGCPVVLSDIPVFREIFEDAACYVDPHSLNSIADGINLVIHDEQYRAQLIKKGLEIQKKYSWDTSAKKFIEIVFFENIFNNS